MTTNSTLITEAFRECNYIGLGSTPSAEEQTEALRRLQSLVSSLPGSVIGIKPKAWHIPFPFNTAPQSRRAPAIYSGEPNRYGDRNLEYPPINSRVILRNTSAQNIYFQYQPLDGALIDIVDAGFTADVTLDANGMFIGTTGNERTVTIEPRTDGRNPSRQYVFREDTASWNLTTSLSLTAEMPYPEQFDDYWITALALRMAPSFGAKQMEVTVRRFQEMTAYIRGWYRQHEEALVGDVGLTEQSYTTGYFGDDPQYRS